MCEDDSFALQTATAKLQAWFTYYYSGHKLLLLQKYCSVLHCNTVSKYWAQRTLAPAPGVQLLISPAVQDAIFIRH